MKMSFFKHQLFARSPFPVTSIAKKAFFVTAIQTRPLFQAVVDCRQVAKLTSQNEIANATYMSWFKSYIHSSCCTLYGIYLKAYRIWGDFFFERDYLNKGLLYMSKAFIAPRNHYSSSDRSLNITSQCFQNSFTGNVQLCSFCSTLTPTNF